MINVPWPAPVVAPAYTKDILRAADERWREERERADALAERVAYLERMLAWAEESA